MRTARNVVQLTRSPVSEFCPVVLDDGRVMYHRWEYIDKGARVGKTVWSMNPDGTMPQELFGVADDTTTVYMYPQPVPGKPHRLVCVGTCHFPQGGCLGAILLVDYGMGLRERGPDPNQPEYAASGQTRSGHEHHAARVRPTPDGAGLVLRDQGRRRTCMTAKAGRGTCTRIPIPVSEREFLVSYKVNPADHYKEVPNAYALYLIDTEGSHRPVHADPKLSCWHPLPLVARRVPPLLQSIARSRNTPPASRPSAS